MTKCFFQFSRGLDWMVLGYNKVLGILIVRRKREDLPR